MAAALQANVSADARRDGSIHDASFHEAYTAPSTPYFRDVGRTYFVYKEIWWMRSRGLFKGPNYWPNQHIDKQVFAVFLHRWKT